MSLVPPGRWLVDLERNPDRVAVAPAAPVFGHRFPEHAPGVQPSVRVAGLALLDCAHLLVAMGGAVVQHLRAHRDDDARRRPTNRAKAASKRHGTEASDAGQDRPRPSPRPQQANDRVPGKGLTVGQRHGRILGVSGEAVALVRRLVFPGSFRVPARRAPDPKLSRMHGSWRLAQRSARGGMCLVARPRYS